MNTNDEIKRYAKQIREDPAMKQHVKTFRIGCGLVLVWMFVALLVFAAMIGMAVKVFHWIAN